MLRTVALWKPRSARSAGVRHEVRADVRVHVFTVAILAQGTNRGDALCAALLSNRVVSIRGESIVFIFCCSSSFFFIFFFPGLAVRREVGADVRLQAFTVAILAQGTTSEHDKLCSTYYCVRCLAIGFAVGLGFPIRVCRRN